MFSHTSLVGNVIHVHLDEQISNSATKSFQNGTFLFELTNRTLVISKFPPIALPFNLNIEKDSTLTFVLEDLDGTVRKQTRTALVSQSMDGSFRIGGIATATPRHSADDGWAIRVFRFRAYMKHVGIETDKELPQWITESATRQRLFWNKIAFLCREARRACSDVPAEAIQKFLTETVRPAIDAFNDSRGRSKGKLKYPKVLLSEEPTNTQLWSFIGALSSREKAGKPNPPGLEEAIREFATQFKTGFSPINDFQRDLPALMEEAAKSFHLRGWELRGQKMSFDAVLKRRKKIKAPFSEGWPKLKYPDQPGYDNWNLSVHLKAADIKIADLDEQGIPSLQLGEPVAAAMSGHPLMTKSRAQKRQLRPALISISDRETKGRFELRFAVLQGRELPKVGWLKEWKLVHKDGKFWICLIIQIRQPLPNTNLAAAGIDIGWRRTGTGIKVATVYDPTRKISKEIHLDLDSKPTDTKHDAREKFVVRMGPSRSWRHHPILSTLAGDNVFEALGGFQHKQDQEKDALKRKIREILGDETPKWIAKAGRTGLHKLAELFPRPELLETMKRWEKTDADYVATYGWMRDKLAGRLAKGYEMVARDLCSWLSGHVGQIVIEEAFLKKSAEKINPDDPVGLQRSVKYRQIAALSVFLSKLQNVAPSYGLKVVKHPGAHTTTTCYHCRFTNLSSEKLKNLCGGCGKLIDQDLNAAFNLSCLGSETSVLLPLP